MTDEVESTRSVLINDCIVVRATGDIDVANAAQFDETIRQAAEEDARVLIVDLSDVSFIDSSGLGVIAANQHARRERGNDNFRVVAAAPHLLKVFEVTGLDQVFSIYPDLASATTA